jgi:Asp-tRNA(Asn)/Glu-tRNA(Gln) amidotransferase A subunit family amidase
MTDSTADLTAAQASRQIASGALTCEAYARAFLERIETLDPEVRAFTWVDRARVLAAARERDRELRRGPLHGIPFAVKDVIDTEDAPTQHNSPIHQGRRTLQDAHCVAVLRASGAVMLGKTDTLEFAAGGRRPLTRNPRDLSRTPGGSSSGSGAAVAAKMAPLALGTQTGGSTIRPAAFCGVHGMKPTLSRISFEGTKHYSHHLDTIGLYGRCVEDLWLMCAAYRIVDASELQRPDERTLRVGLWPTPLWSEADADAQRALDAAAALFSKAGVQIVPVTLSERFDSLTDAQDALMHEGGRAAFLPEYLTRRDLLHPDFVEKVENRRGYTAERMRAALDLVSDCRREFEASFGRYDAVMTLSAPGEATPGLTSQGLANFNRIFTAMGVPCVSLPGMLGDDGLPIGIQLIERRYEDERLLRVAAALSPLLIEQGISR